jgi:hypothetical protein
MPETTDVLSVRVDRALYEEATDVAAVTESRCDEGTHVVRLYINEGAEQDHRVVARCQKCSSAWTLATRVLHHPILTEDPKP